MTFVARSPASGQTGSCPTTWRSAELGAGWLVVLAVQALAAIGKMVLRGVSR
jgi:hypothetical protein